MTEQLVPLSQPEETDSDRKGESNMEQLRSIPRQPPKQNQIKVDISKTQYPLLKQVLCDDMGHKVWSNREPKQENNLFWNDNYVTEDFVKKLKSYQKTNHFACSHELGRKNSLCKNLSRMQCEFPSDYDFFPQTWVLPEQQAACRSYMRDNPQKWLIVKPTAESQGRGIYLTRKPQFREEVVVQQYIDNPFLIDNAKFDFRLYVLVKSLMPLKIFIFKEGLARLATQDYQLPESSNISMTQMHLTNYAINKMSPSYLWNKDETQDNVGHKRSYTATMQILQKSGCDTSALQREIEQIVIKTVMSGYGKMLQAYRNARGIKQECESVCFQLLGFDIMVTSEFKPILIEVNHSPSFLAQTPLDYAIKKCLLRDTFNLINMNSEGKDNMVRKPKQEDNQVKLPNWCLQKADEAYELRNLGAFRKIYPFNGKMSPEEDKIKRLELYIRGRKESPEVKNIQIRKVMPKPRDQPGQPVIKDQPAQPRIKNQQRIREKPAQPQRNSYRTSESSLPKKRKTDGDFFGFQKTYVRPQLRSQHSRKKISKKQKYIPNKQPKKLIPNTTVYHRSKCNSLRDTEPIKARPTVPVHKLIPIQIKKVSLELFSKDHRVTKKQPQSSDPQRIYKYQRFLHFQTQNRFFSQEDREVSMNLPTGQELQANQINQMTANTNELETIRLVGREQKHYSELHKRLEQDISPVQLSRPNTIQFVVKNQPDPQNHFNHSRRVYKQLSK